MNVKRILKAVAGLTVLSLPIGAVADTDGIVTKVSKYSVEETMDRLEAVAKTKQATVFARVDYSVMAKKIGVKMRPAQLLIFGRGKGSPPMIQVNPLVGLDLPPKVLVYEDHDGKVKLSYVVGDYLKKRHNVMGRDKKFAGLTRMLNAVTDKALE